MEVENLLGLSIHSHPQDLLALRVRRPELPITEYHSVSLLHSTAQVNRHSRENNVPLHPALN